MTIEVHNEQQQNAADDAKRRNAEIIATTSEAPSFMSGPGFLLAQRIATALERASILPDAFRGADNAGNRLIALGMASRLNCDPVLLMQNVDIIHGRPTMRAKFKLALFNTSGKYAPIRYELSGEGDDFGCLAYTSDRRTAERIDGPRITVGLAKAEGWATKPGSKWKTMPDLMLRYRAASWLIDTLDPGVSFGLPTDDEAHDVGPLAVAPVVVAPQPERVAQTDAIKAKIAARAPIVDASPIAPEEPTEEPALKAAKPEWLASEDLARAHVEAIDNLRHLEASARKHGARSAGLREMYAGRLIALSVDDQGSRMDAAAARKHVAGWSKEGPKS